jgi:8-oxo-dGTP pyrophosphatase MutT (NUDIX family)
MINTKISTSCIIEYNKKILMIYEEQDGKISWDIPAGGLDKGETIHEGVLREVYEETGLIIKNPVNKKVLQYIESNRTTINFLFYIKLSKKPETNCSHQDADEDILCTQWFTREQVVDIISNSETENNLASARLQIWVNGFSGNDLVQIVI